MILKKSKLVESVGIFISVNCFRFHPSAWDMANMRFGVNPSETLGRTKVKA